jgi:lipoprotein-releasing system permease protein
MFGAFERMVAMRYLRARRREGFISIIAWFSLLGIALGVATLIIVMSVMNGFRAELLSRILGLNGHITVSRAGEPLEDFDALAAKVRGMAGVHTVAPLVEGQALLAARGRATGVVLRGLRAEDLRQRPLLADNIRAGDLDGFAGGEAVMIGRRLAERFNLKVGDPITLVSPQVAETGFGIMPRLKRTAVGAIFEVGMYEYDNTFVYMPLQVAQPFMQLRDAVSSLDVVLDDINAVPRKVLEILRTLGPGYLVRDWQTINRSFFNAIQVERNVMFLILTLIILVAAFNIISSLIMLVKDKGRDIAVLRTMGATRGMVMRIFFLAGASLGLVGTVAGSVLGVLFAVNIEAIREFVEGFADSNLFAPEIYFLSHLPSQIEPMQVTGIIVMAMALTFLATLYPSWRAARLDPVEALRYE